MPAKSDNIPPMPAEIELTSRTARFYDAWNPRPGKAITVFRYALLIASAQAVLLAESVWIRGVGWIVSMYALSALAAWGGSHWKGFRQGWIAGQMKDGE